MFGIRLIGNSLKIKLIQVFVIKLNTWVFRFGDSFFFYLLKKNLLKNRTSRGLDTRLAYSLNYNFVFLYF